MNRRLYRPVGLYELRDIRESGYRAFPPLRHLQPLFYPMLDVKYAVQIARDWNTQEAGSGYMGAVTAFDMDAGYLRQFEEHVVGVSAYKELWIPAEQLDEFNTHIVGTICVLTTFYGDKFTDEKPW